MIMKKEKKYQIKCYISEFDRDCIERYSKTSSKIVSAYVRETASNFAHLIMNGVYWMNIVKHCIL